MEIQLKIIGVLLILLACIHAVFPKYFNWNKELETLSLINKQMMKVHTLFIALTIFLMGLLCFTSAADIITTSLGKKIALGLAVFWSVRLAIQFVGYSSKLWKGKVFETAIHIIFSALWLYLSCIFFKVYIK